MEILITGNTVLCSTMAMEALGRRENTRANVGYGCRNLYRSREESKEENFVKLSMGKFKIS